MHFPSTQSSSTLATRTPLQHLRRCRKPTSTLWADPKEREGLSLTKAMLRSSSLPLSDVLCRYLRLKCTDSIFEETLLALRNLTNVTGALDLVEERDTVLTRFITLAVPGWDALLLRLYCTLRTACPSVTWPA